MSGQVYPVERHTDFLRQRQVKNRQTDRDPGLAVDDLVEITVPGVEVVFPVTFVPLFYEKGPVDLSEDLPRLREPAGQRSRTRSAS